MLYQVKLGVLGLEKLGKSYAALVKEHVKSLSLIAAAGRTQQELLFAKNDLSLEYVYSDEKSLIENHDIDAVAIFGPPSRRPHQAISAIEAGKHVFMADPIALNVEDAIAVHNCAKSHPSQVVMISSQVRFHPLMNAVHGVIGNGDIGVINEINLDSAFFNGWNRVLSSASGSAFFDSALDEIDFCLWLLGHQIQRVNVTRNDDTFICEGSSSKNVSITITVQKASKKEQSYINIFGDKGQLSISNTNKSSFKLIKDTGEKVDIHLDDYNGFGFPEYLQLHLFTQSILYREKRANSTQQAVEVVKLAVAFEKSVVLSEKIDLF